MFTRRRPCMRVHAACAVLRRERRSPASAAARRPCCLRPDVTAFRLSLRCALCIRAHSRMPDFAAELARATAERTRLQRQAQRERPRRHTQRERAFLTATIAFCHEPTAGPTLAEAIQRKHARVIDLDVATCTHEIGDRFLKTPADTLAAWLDWSDHLSRGTWAEARRLVEDARLLH